MLNKNFREFIELLNAGGVKYLIGGGNAIGYHGHPRYAKDLDVFDAMSRENAEKLVAVLEDFGFADNPPSRKPFLTPRRIVETGREGIHWRHAGWRTPIGISHPIVLPLTTAVAYRMFF